MAYGTNQQHFGSTGGRSHTAGAGVNPRRRVIQHNRNNYDVMVTSEGHHNVENGNINVSQDSKYGGPSYSVKYLGIVDGSMGVLSRKMALLNYNQARN